MAGRVGGTHCITATLSPTYKLASIWSLRYNPGNDISVLDPRLPEGIWVRMPQWCSMDDMRSDSILLFRIFHLHRASRKEDVALDCFNSR